jgi:hypothetical protein
MVAGHGAFGEVDLAEQHGTRRVEPLDHGGVVVRHEVPANPQPPHGGNVAGIAEILDGHRDAVQRAAVLT